MVREHAPDAVYYDISVNNVLLQCEASGHDHAPGSGRPIADAFSTMFRETNAAMAREAGRPIPAGAEIGPASLRVVNAPYTGNVESNAVAFILGERIAVTGVTRVGNELLVEGRGFSPRTVVNLFNRQDWQVVSALHT